MSDTSEEYAASRVPDDRTVGGFRIGMVVGVMAFGVGPLIVGGQVAGAVGLYNALIAFLAGGVILSILAALVGYVGVRNRVSSYVLTKSVFGTRSAVFLNLAIAVSLLGWYGISMDIMSATIQRLSDVLFGYQSVAWPIEIVAGVVMVGTTIYGFSLLERLSVVVAPVLALITVYIGVNGYLNWDPQQQFIAGQESMTGGEAVTAVTGVFIMTAALMSDFTRFGRNGRDAVSASVVPFTGFASVSYTCGALAAVALQNTDALANMLALGLGVLALSMVLLSSWIINVINIYSASLSAGSLFVKTPQWLLVVVAGVLGTVAALFNLLEGILAFLFALSAVFGPIGGIFIADFFVLRRCRPYELDFSDDARSFNWYALVAWITGTGVAIASNQLGLGLVGIEVVDATLVTILVYLLIAWRTPMNLRNTIADGSHA